MNITHPVCLLTKRLATREELTRVLARQDGFRLVSPGEADDLGLVVLELGDDLEDDFESIASLVTDPRVGEVFVASRQKDPDLIIRAMRAGVSEFLSQPFRSDEVLAALEGYARRRRTTRAASPAAVPASAGGRLIHIMGAKGGVGATTVAVNLAVLAARSPAGNAPAPDAKKADRGLTKLGGRNAARDMQAVGDMALTTGGPALAPAALPLAALMDMRLPQGDVPLFLDMEYSRTWADGARNLGRLDATFLRSLAERHASGLEVFASPDTGDDLDAISPRAVKAVLDLARALYAVTVVDGGPYADELALVSMQEAETILLVTDLALPAPAGARRLLDDVAAAAPAVAARIQLVVNRMSPQAGVDLTEAERLLERKVFATVGDDYGAAVSAINQGVPLCEAAPRSVAARSLAKLAERLAPAAATPGNGGAAPGMKAGSLFARLLHRKGDDTHEPNRRGMERAPEHERGGLLPHGVLLLGARG
ncbi:response regulator [Nitratidesulfovibrio liaohensis]|uniref:Response regulator n=1 Tax=Nitratidesulfovibrio liaohensis TaxID=2604158 RepID=A0ABY9R3C1_9BACT|nr:response regulator [Nitratidesulfovibrio liaohensis]WMW65070.1 response regulator [Nitratidesulfovibrio liaohensis]